MKPLSYDQTPVAVMTLKEGSTTSAFVDEDVVAVSSRWVGRQVSSGTAYPKVATRLAALLADFMRLHPRIVTKQVPRNMGVIEQMQAFAAMPEELADCYADGERGILNTRTAFNAAGTAIKQPNLRPMLEKHVTKDSPKLKFGRLAVPNEAPELATILQARFAETGYPAIFEHAEGNDPHHVYFLCIGSNPKTVYLKVADSLASCHQPFTIGGSVTMLSPEAWAILAAVGWHVFREQLVEGGNGARTERPGTKDLRRLRRQWSGAIASLKEVGLGPPSNGFSEEPAIHQPPSSALIAELHSYSLAAAGQWAWSGRGNHCMEGVLAFCQTAKRRRTHHEALAEGKV